MEIEINQTWLIVIVWAMNLGVASRFSLQKLGKIVINKFGEEN